MSSVINGVWRQATNTKIPALTHNFSVRVPITANTTGTYQVPANTSNLAQLTPAQAPNNYAPQQSPSLPNNKPQQGSRFFVTQLVLRDATAALSGTGATTPANVQLINVTQGNAVIGQVGTVAGTNAPYTVGSITNGTVIVNPYDQLAVTFNAQSGGTPSTAVSFTLDVIGLYQQAV